MTRERWTDERLDNLAYHGDDRYRRLKEENRKLRQTCQRRAENCVTTFETYVRI